MKFVIVVVSIVALINTTEARFDNKIRRQSSSCVFTYLALSSDERDCLSLDSDQGLSIDQMEQLCSSEICITAAKKLLQGCKSDIEQQLPEEYRSIDIGAFFDLFCTRVSDGTFCYSNLPLFNNTMDPVGSCESVLDGGVCSDDCHQGLEHYNSTCCFASYLALVPVNQYSTRPTDLWSRCQIVSPQLCNNMSGSTGTNDGTSTDHPPNTDNPPNTDHPPNTNNPPNTDGSSNTDRPTASGGNHGTPVDDRGSDDDDNDKYGYIGIAIGAIMIIVITIVAVLITLFVCNRKRSRSSTASSRDTMRMSLAMNEDPDD